MPQRDVVEFQPNVPVVVSLAYAAGKIIDTSRGQRVMFTLSDGRVMFLDLGAAERVNELQVKPRQPFYIVKNQESKRCSPIEWRAWLSPDPDCGEQQNGTFSVPKLPGPSVSAPAPVAAAVRPSPDAQPANGNGSKPAIEIHQGWAHFCWSARSRWWMSMPRRCPKAPGNMATP
jgi:hypothetical protein